MVRAISGSGGKGSDRRPRSKHVSQKEFDLRWDLAWGKISKEYFEKQMILLKEKNNGLEKETKNY